MGEDGWHGLPGGGDGAHGWVGPSAWQSGGGGHILAVRVLAHDECEVHASFSQVKHMNSLPCSLNNTIALGTCEKAWPVR